MSMSLRILKLKAKQTNPRYSNNRRQILNMTNRGSVIGSNAKYGGAGCAKCSGGVRSTTCSSDSVLPNGCKNGCGCRFDGLSQPAPQMSYRNYLNKRSNAAYRPGGAPCCDISGRITSVWKQTTGKTSASEVTEIKRLKALYCAATTHKQLVNPLTGKITSRSSGSVCGAYGHGPKCVCGWAITKAQRWFNRINHTVCGVTKTLPGYRTAGEQVALIKAAPMACTTDP